MAIPALSLETRRQPGPLPGMGSRRAKSVLDWLAFEPCDSCQSQGKNCDVQNAEWCFKHSGWKKITSGHRVDPLSGTNTGRVTLQAPWEIWVLVLGAGGRTRP